MITRTLLIVLITLFSWQSYGQDLKEWKKVVVPEFEKTAKAYPKAGLSMCLIQDGKITDMRARGYRDKAQKLPNTPATIVSWGSITKG